MHNITIKHLLLLLAFSSLSLLMSCGEDGPAEGSTDPTEQADSSTTAPNPAEGTSEYNGQEKARTLSDDAISGTYVYKDQGNPEGGGYLVIQVLDNGRLKFELDINNGPPNYHSGTAVGEMELDGNTAVYNTSEYAMQGQDPCVISFLFVDGMVEIEQEQGVDMSCGFGQGVVARGIYTKKNDTPIFQYEGGR